MDSKKREWSQVHELLTQCRATIESSAERTRSARLVVDRAKVLLDNSEAVRTAAEAARAPAGRAPVGHARFSISPGRCAPVKK